MSGVTERLRSRLPSISVGMLSANILELGAELAQLAEAGAEFVHVDVMDGVFCPQMTVGPSVVKAIPELFIKDVHLMVHEPLDKVRSYVDAGADVLTIHVESSLHPHRVLQSLGSFEIVRGVALNPGTPLTALDPLLDELELILILAVNPGWPGQSFLPSTSKRIADTRKLTAGRDILVGVDGGVTKENIAYVAALGADLVVAGSAVFDGVSSRDNAKLMLETIRAGAAYSDGVQKELRAGVKI